MDFSQKSGNSVISCRIVVYHKILFVFLLPSVFFSFFYLLKLVLLSVLKKIISINIQNARIEFVVNF